MADAVALTDAVFTALRILERLRRPLPVCLHPKLVAAVVHIVASIFNGVACFGAAEGVQVREARLLPGHLDAGDGIRYRSRLGDHGRQGERGENHRDRRRRVVTLATAR